MGLKGVYAQKFNHRVVLLYPNSAYDSKNVMVMENPWIHRSNGYRAVIFIFGTMKDGFALRADLEKLIPKALW